MIEPGPKKDSSEMPAGKILYNHLTFAVFLGWGVYLIITQDFHWGGARITGLSALCCGIGITCTTLGLFVRAITKEGEVSLFQKSAMICLFLVGVLSILYFMYDQISIYFQN